jgi:predicted metal-dependent HD superfamily phosphohydrolase
MNYADLTEKVKHELTHFFKKHQNPGFIYHNKEHTEEVVSHVTEISDHYQLDDKDRFVVTSAAWFHDMGYFTGEASGHEERGANAAAEFLKGIDVHEKQIQAVKSCILATKLPQSPKNLLEQIVCDADLFHFGTDQFSERNKLMRKEAEWRAGQKISKSDWRKSTIDLLESHHFHTDFCQKLLDAKKGKNLKKQIEKASDDSDEEPILFKSPENLAPETKPEVTEIKKPKFDRPDKGIETMFRITSNNHQRLSDMADNKANIMITTTSIILSVLLSVLVRKLEENPYLTIPTMLLITICVITMVFSILSTRPSLPHGTFTQEDIREKKVNLLFFGNFYRMNFDDYSNGMQEMMNDREFLYGTLTRDVYAQGVVLGRKYRLLRLAYNVFMFGIVVSVLAFVIASFFSGGSADL